VIGVSVGFPESCGRSRANRSEPGTMLGVLRPIEGPPQALEKAGSRRQRRGHAGCGAARGRARGRDHARTGFGSAILVDGELAPHLEISQIPSARRDLRPAARAAARSGSAQQVSRRVERRSTCSHADELRCSLHRRREARHLKLELPRDVRLVANECGMKGGAALWRDGASSLEDAQARRVLPLHSSWKIVV